jgi:hypothetical protein
VIGGFSQPLDQGIPELPQGMAEAHERSSGCAMTFRSAAHSFNYIVEAASGDGAAAAPPLSAPRE